MIYAQRKATRRGFTLVEMLVALALTMFIMIILSEAFATGLDVFGQLKAIGDMEENLRAAATAVRTDLAADHFEAKKRLSDFTFYVNPPEQGFISIASQPAGLVNEGTDGMTNSWRSTTCVLHMTVKRRGNQRQDFFTTAIPGNSPVFATPTVFFNQPSDARMQDANANNANPAPYNSQWAEVMYYLVPTGTTVTPNVVGTGGTPLFALYRAERLVVGDNTYLNWGNNGGPMLQVNPANASTYAQMSWIAQGQNMMFSTPADLVTAANRSMIANPPTPAMRDSALLIGNVVSFQVRVLNASAASDFQDISFDSATAAANPPGQILAVAVILRIWDQKTQQARQITVMQDM